MKKIHDELFRCDLCGQYSRTGVTESKPTVPTRVCDGCIGDAAKLLIGDGRPGSNGPMKRGLGSLSFPTVGREE